MKKNNTSILILIITLSVILRIINLNQSFWLDEAAQVIESARPLSQQINIIADFHPPLFHILLNFWMRISHSEVWIRILSVIFGIGSIVFMYFIVQKNNKAAYITSFLLAFSPYHIWYSQEARPYMLFVFLTVFSSFLLLKRKWFFYFISIVSLVYSLYFWPFVILGHAAFVYLKYRKFIKNYIISTVSAILFFIPWLGYFIDQLNTGLHGMFTGWTGVVSFTPLKAVALMFVKFILGKGTIENNFIYSLVVLPTFLFFLISTLIQIKSKKIDFSLIFFWVGLISSFLVSLFVPILAPQRLLFLLPFFYFEISKFLMRFSGRTLYFMLSVLFLTQFLGISQYWFDSAVQREQWRQAVYYVENDSSISSRAAVFVFPDPFAPYIWYQKEKLESLSIAPAFILRDQDLASFEKRLINQKKLYLFQYLTGLTDPTNKVGVFLQNNGFVNTQIKNFPGVGFIYIYDKI